MDLDGVVEKLKANTAQPYARYHKEEVHSVNKIRKMFQDLTQPYKGNLKSGIKIIKPTDFKIKLNHDNHPTKTIPNRTPDMFSKEELKLDRKTTTQLSKEDQPSHSKEDYNKDRKTKDSCVIDRKTSTLGTIGIQTCSVTTQPKFKPVSNPTVIGKTLNKDRKTGPPPSEEDSVIHSK